MTHLEYVGSRTGLFLLAFLLLASAPAAAQKVPISFDDYHGYTGTIDYLQKVAAAYPNIAELIEIGRSNMNRSIYVLVVSNSNTGTTVDKFVALRNMRKENVKNVTPMKPDQGKPGVWIDGGTHGNEYTGTEVCLYTIDKLVSGYGANPEITRLIDANVFYICPIVNPDGVYSSVEAGISQRQNSMREDDDKDGRINEDGPDDLNGDGVISQFRYKDPEGRYYISDKDARVMIRLGRDETTTKERYSVIWEDKDNDGDGKRGEDSERGIDVNRNFPEGWFKDDDTQGGSGYYPSSSPEAHAVLEFFTNHTNILMAQSFHTSGGFTYRPFARWPDSRIAPKDLAVYDRVMGKKYLELIGEEVPEAWKANQAETRQTEAASAERPRGGARGAARTPSPPRGWRHPYNDEQKRPYGYGIFLDWAYGQFGAYAMSTELWNWRKDTKGLPGFSGEDDRALWEGAYIDYQDKLGGKRFLPWQKFNHPDLGEGEIGGWVSKYSPGNAIPGETLRGVCDTHWQFELYKATLLPRIEIADAQAKILYTTDSAAEAKVRREGDTFTVEKGRGAGRYKVVQVTATVKNTGPLPTHLARGARLEGNREDVVWLLGDRDKVKFLEGSPWMKLGVLEGTLDLSGYGTQEEETATRRPGMPGAPSRMRRQEGPEETQVKGTGASRTATWLVAIEGDAPLRILVTSQKGGTTVKELSINQ